MRGIISHGVRPYPPAAILRLIFELEDMVKVFISVDMEGVSGVVHPAQLSPTGADYRRGRELQTGDANAAADGAFDGGATEVIINDSHWVQRNLLIEQLHPSARLISGSIKPLGMVQGVEGADVALFIGYHARNGTAYAVADHTWSASCLSDLRINGLSVGETGLNAYLCGHFGVPVGMLSGDQALEAEAREMLPQAEIAVVKWATGRWAAECLPLEESHQLIRERAAAAVRAAGSLGPTRAEVPCAFSLDLMTSEMADRAESVPGVQREGGRTINFEAPDVLQGFAVFRTVMNLASLYTEF